MRKFALFFAGASVLAAASAYSAFFNLFSYFAQYDDTGSMLALIQGFNEHGNLYRNHSGGYGPFYSEFYWFVGKVLRVPITHDGIRWVALALWVGSALAAGVSAFRVTRRIWVGLLVQALSFEALNFLVDEPGHPISLVAALLSALVLVLNWPREDTLGRLPAVSAGMFLGLLTMTKINLGLFALAGAGTAWIYCSPPDRWGHALRWLSGFLFCVMSIVLVQPPWPPEIRLIFVTYFLCILLAILVSGQGAYLEWRSLRRVAVWAFSGFGLCVLLCLSGVLLSGTRWSDLVHGLIVLPMALRTVFISLPDMGRIDAVMALVSLLGAIAWRIATRISPHRGEWLTLVLRLGFILLVPAWAFGFSSRWALTVFLWIAAIPLTLEANQRESGTERLVRLTLVLLAAGQLLGVYPVTGAQVTIPFFLGSLCMVHVLHGLFFSLKQIGLFTARPWIRLAILVALVAVPSMALATLWIGRTQSVAKEYWARDPLGLPGTHLVRLRREDAATCRCLAENLRRCRPSFLSLPGLNSLYFWAERPFPTGVTAGSNVALLSDEEQRSLVETGRTCKPFTLVLHQDLLFLNLNYRYHAGGPLIDFLKDECRHVGLVRGYDFWSLNADPRPSFIYCASLGTELLPDDSNWITVSLPARLGKVGFASVLDLTTHESLKVRQQVQENAEPPAGPAPDEAIREFTFDNPDSARVTFGTVNNFLVQLWDDGGQLIADVPFVLLRR